MIQDISPSRLDNSYKDYTLREQDTLLFFDQEGKILVKLNDGFAQFTTGADAGDARCIYLFSIDEKRYFLALDVSDFNTDDFGYRGIRDMRDMCEGKEVYAVFTAYHLWQWYADNRYCGRCRGELTLSSKERALVCPDCGHTVYPRINPAVIVGVTNGDRLLITRYSRGFAHNALVAGFTEIGETMEETVAREVMEEAGIKVRNIRYYKSQPWGMAQDVLMGFYCDVDGDTTIHMDDTELKYAQWVQREEIELQPNNLSLTNEMMRMFKEGHIK